MPSRWGNLLGSHLSLLSPVVLERVLGEGALKTVSREAFNVLFSASSRSLSIFLCLSVTPLFLSPFLRSLANCHFIL
jgi:hypothetical protein